ncbi:MAG: P-type conjugative transfer protein VirB9 [Wolbachia endosymbiont of Menacanthus eurysternus]|nr:MAG: P-type conjugative transfer protein VirB9 [Wolbachia endosymbiont of Menacanthus eurysternus]
MNMFKILLIFIILLHSNLTVSFDYSKFSSVDKRIKTFVYNPNEIFEVVFSQGYYSYIEFAEGEKIKNIAIGDASSWNISPYDNKLLIMPFEVSGRTNMIITTTKKRSYIFDLISKPNSDKYSDSNTEKIDSNHYREKDIFYVVRFHYPREEDELDIDDEVLMLTQTQYFTSKPESLIQKNDTQYNYVYIDNGVDISMIPIELFDDGYLTYFKFIDNDKIPQIFAGEGKIKLPCRRLLFDGYIVIKGVHKRLFMRYEDNEVEIINKSL